MTNKEAFREFSAAFVFVLSVFGAGLLLLTLLGKPSDKVEKFEVVDHYGTCAVVRYFPEGRGESVYFLDCGNQHLTK